MRKLGFLLALILFSTAFADYDDYSTNCTAAGHDWFVINGDLGNLNNVYQGSGSYFYHIDAGDLNNDGWDDFIAAIRVNINNKDGTFAGTSYSVGGNPRVPVIADFNKDGWLDWAIGTQSDDEVNILMNDGDGTFTNTDSYTLSNENPYALGVGDFDNDDWLDIAVCTKGITNVDSAVTILFNDGDGTFTLDSTDYIPGQLVQDITVADFNNDGWLDFIVTNLNENVVSYFLNDADGTFTKQSGIAGDNNLFGIDAADFNNDGWTDFAVTSYSDGTLNVFLNDGDGTFTIEPDYVSGAQPTEVSSIDLNHDGWIDLVVVKALDGTNDLAAFLNDGDGTFTRQANYTLLSRPYDVALGDFNDDELEDLVIIDQTNNYASILYKTPEYGGVGSLCCGDDYIIHGYWDNFYNSSHLCYGYPTINADLNKNYCEFLGYNWLSNSGNFSPALDIDSAFDGWSVFGADIDVDGDLDVVAAGRDDDDITWWENTAGDGSSWTEHAIDDGTFDRPEDVFAADIDGDNDIDVLAVAYLDDQITWWNNTNGVGTSWTEHTIDGAFDGGQSVFAADMDSDGDMDVLGAAYHGEFQWYENTAGDGSSWTMHSIDILVVNANGVFPADIDGDHDLDVVGVVGNDEDLYWYENDNGSGVSWTEHVIDSSIGGTPRDSFVGDLDGDSDLDILVAYTGGLAWWNNTDGAGSFSSGLTIDSMQGTGVFVADVDGDGDMDVLATDQLNHDVSWYENTAGDASSWTEHIIDDAAFGDNPRSVFSGDIDGDGDLDVLSATAGDDNITLWKNLGYNGTGAPCWGDDVDDCFTNGTANGGDFDDCQFLCENQGHTWLTGSPVGFGSPCCGDDSLPNTFYDRFYNSSHLCYGYVTTNSDLDKGYCEARGYSWLTNSPIFSYVANINSGRSTKVLFVDIDSDSDLDIIMDSDNCLDKGINNGSGSYTFSYVVACANLGEYSVGDVDGDGHVDIIKADEAGDVMKYINDGLGNFSLTIFETGGNQYSYDLVMGDLDSDGDNDFIATDITKTLYKWINNGTGSFTKSSLGTTLNLGYSLLLFDIDGDNDLDIIVGSSPNYKLINDGFGNFGRPISIGYDSVGSAYYTDFGDIDGDGDLDFVVNDFGGGVDKWVNDGTGSFTMSNVRLGGTTGYSIELGDVDGDGDLDMFSGDIVGDVYQYINDGTGSFSISQLINVGTRVTSLGLQDSDLDGDPELFVGLYTGSNYLYDNLGINGTNGPCCGDDYILNGYWENFYNSTHLCYGYLTTNADLNKDFCEFRGHDWFYSPNTFSNDVTYSVGIHPNDIAAADFDGDGDLDVVIPDYDEDAPEDDFSVLFNDGSGVFSGLQNYGAGNRQRSAVTADFDGDGDVDIGITNTDNQAISVLFNDGSGVFSGRTDSGIGPDTRSGVVAADFDGDGDVDVAAINFAFSGATFSVVFNDGSGVFTGRQSYGVGNWAWEITAADFDGDGDLDVATTSRNDDDFSVLFNDGSGVFSGRTDYAVGTGPYDIAAADFDDDGDLDVAVLNWNDGDMSVLFNDGSGVFSGRTDYSADNDPWGTDYPRNIAPADLDNDGDLDIIALNSGYFCVLYNNGAGAFSSCQAYNTGSDPQGLAVVDFDGDGDLDVATGNYGSGDFSVLLNIGINGTSGPCCGDDGASDDFYNSSRACADGSGTFDGDALQGFCTVLGYNWLAGTTTGANPSCCGDDGVSDVFYNGSIGSTSYFCHLGNLTQQEIDVNQTICEYYYDWLSGGTAQGSKCCGDDGPSDDFGNNTLSCCCNGLVIANGVNCDLDQDGNVDSVCVDGRLPEVFISESDYDEAYIMSDYSPEFLIRNTGNVTVCFTDVNIFNTTRNYSPDSKNPACINPGNSGLFKFNFGSFACDDLDAQFNMIANFTYQKTTLETDSLISYLNFRVRSPLDIESIEPSITASLPVNVNEFENLLVTLSNKGTNSINYNVDIQAVSDTLLLLKIPEGQYTIDELKTEEFSLLPRTSIIYQLKIAALSEGEKTISLTFNNTGACTNITDSLSFKIQGIDIDRGFLDIAEIPGLDWIAIIVLMLIASIVIYYKVLKT